MISYQLTSFLIAAAVAVAIIWLVRRNRLDPGRAIWWIAVATVIALAGAFSGVVDWIGMRLGVSYPPVLVLLAGVGVLLIKVLTMDIARSEQRQQIRILAQRVAILEQQLGDSDGEHQRSRS